MNDRSVKIRLEIEKVYKELSGKGLFDKDIKSCDQFEGVVLNAAKKVSSTTDATLQQIKGVLNTFMTSYKNLSEVRIVDKNDPLQRGNYVDSLKKNFNANTIRETLQRWIEDYLSELYKLDFKPKDKKSQRRKDEAYAYDEAQIEKFSVLSKDLNTYIVDETVLRNRLKTAIDSKRQEWDDYTKQKNTNKGLGIEESRALLEKKGKEFNGIKLSALTNDFIGESINKLKNLFSGVISDAKKDSNKSTPGTEPVNSHRGLLSRAIEIRNQAKNIGDVNNVTGKITSELSNGSSSAELNNTLNSTAEELKESAKKTSQAAEDLKNSAKNTYQASDEAKKTTKAQEKLNNRKKIAQRNVNSENYKRGENNNLDNYEKTFNDNLRIIEEKNKELSAISAKYPNEPNRDKWSKEDRNAASSLDEAIDRLNRTNNSISKFIGTKGWNDLLPATMASTYANAYKKMYGGKDDEKTFWDIQKEYGKKFIEGIRNIDTNNIAIDAVKKFVPKFFEDLLTSGGNAAYNWRKNSVFMKYAKETNEYSNFVKEQKKKDGTITDDKIEKLFLKNKGARTRVLGELAQKDSEKGTNIVGKITQAGSALFTVTSGVIGVLGSFADVCKKLGEEAVVAYENIQALQTQLGVVFSSQGEANSMFQKFADYAIVSPFGVNTMVQQGIQLKQSGVGGSELLDVMKRIGDISSGNQEKMKSISDVYSRIIASTTVTAKDMRQLVNAGVPAYDALTKAMQENPRGRNVSQGNIRSLLTAGKVSSDDFVRMLNNLTDEGGMFYGATKTGAKTLKARKQNLSDIRELSLASLGENIVNAGGTRGIEDSYYGKLLSFQERVWGILKEWNTDGIMTRSINQAKGKMDAYNMSSALMNKPETSESLRTALMKSRADYAYGEYVTAASKYYQSKKSEIIGDKVVLSDEDYQTIKYAITAIQRARVDTNYSGFSEQDLLDLYLKDNPFNGFSLVDLENLKNNSISKSRLEELKNESGFENYKAEDNVVKFSEALTRGSDSVENFIKKIEGATDTVTKERQRYESTSIGSLIKSDNEYKVKQDLKNAMNGYTSRWNPETEKTELTKFNEYGDKLTSKNLVVKTGKDNPFGLVLSEYEDFVEKMASSQELLKLSADDLFEKDLYGTVTDKVSENAKKSWDKLHDNLDVLSKLIENDSNEIGEDTKNSIINTVNDMLRLSGKDLSKGNGAKGNLETMSSFSKRLEEEIGKISDVSIRKMYQQALNNTFTDITYDNIRQEAINKSGNPHLWAEALSKLTGIASNRVSLEGFSNGEAKAFIKYRNELAPKNLTKALVSAFVTTNTLSLKQVAKEFGPAKKDNRGNYVYDWKQISENLTDKASKSDNAELRNAAVSSIQEQINALNELTIGSMALGETAEEVRAGLNSMGVAFKYELYDAGNGLMKFTDATMEAAEALKREKEIRLSELKMSNIIADYRNSKKEKVTEESIKGYIAGNLAKNGVNNEKLRTQAGLDEAVNEYIGPVKQLLNEVETGNIVDRLYKARKIDLPGSGYDKTRTFDNFLHNIYYGKDQAAYSRLHNPQNYKGNAVPDISKAKTKEDFINLGLKENVLKSLEPAFKEYTRERKSYTALTFAEGDPDLVNSLKNLKSSIDGSKTIYERAADVNNGATNFREELKDLVFRYGSMSEAEKYDTELVFEKLDIDLKALVKSNEDLTGINNEILKRNKNNKGWTAFAANAATVNNFTDGLNGVDIDVADGKYFKKVKKLDVAKEYFKALSHTGNETEKAIADMMNRRGFSNFDEIERELQKYGGTETASRIERDINNLYIEKRRAQGESLGDYDKSPFFTSDWERKLNKEVYGLNEYTSKKGRNDFIHNNIMDLYVNPETFSVDKILAADGNKAVGLNMGDVIKRAGVDEYGGVFNPAKDKALADRNNALREKLRSSSYFSSNEFMALDENTQTKQLTEQFETIQEIISSMDPTGIDKLTNSTRAFAESSALAADRLSAIDELKDGLGKAFKQASLQGYEATMKSIGKSIGDAYVNSKSMSDVWKNAGAAMRGVLSNLADQASQLMLNAGLRIIADEGKAGLGRGLALIAASGLGSLISGLFSASEDSGSDRDDELERLQKLKDNMAELLQQARNDAEYYEKELKNKKAISTNMTYTTEKVNDMILTPQGQFSTAPDDYIFAMKHPEDLMRGSVPVINFSVVNNSSSVETRTEQRNNSDGSVDFVTIIDDVVQQGIAQGRYNDAFSAMQSVQKGTQTYA